MSIYLTEQELSALEGSNYIYTSLYIYLRRHMDGESFIVGLKRGISYQSISEALYIEPERGIKSGSPHKSTIRRALDRLVKLGLISSIGNDEKLVFKCIFAKRNFSKSNKADTKPTHQADTPKPSPLLAPQHKADTPKNTKADTPLVSINTINKLPPPKNVTLYEVNQSAEGEGADKYLIFPTLSKAHIEQIKALIKPLDTATKQDLLDELSGAIAYRQVKNPIGYMRVIANKALGGIFIGELMYTVRQQRERKIENDAAISMAMLPRDETPKIKTASRKKPDGVRKLTDYLKLPVNE